MRCGRAGAGSGAFEVVSAAEKGPSEKTDSDTCIGTRAGRIRAGSPSLWHSVRPFHRTWQVSSLTTSTDCAFYSCQHPLLRSSLPLLTSYRRSNSDSQGQRFSESSRPSRPPFHRHLQQRRARHRPRSRSPARTRSAGEGLCLRSHDGSFARLSKRAELTSGAPGDQRRIGPSHERFPSRPFLSLRPDMGRREQVPQGPRDSR